MPVSLPCCSLIYHHNYHYPIALKSYNDVRFMGLHTIPGLGTFNIFIKTLIMTHYDLSSYKYVNESRLSNVRNICI